MHKNLILLAGGAILLFATTSMAQDAVLGQMYGNGVHAYFSGDHKGAFNKLSSAIELGSEDPRCFYFRGLAYIKLGREHEAKLDFASGAKFEADDVNKFYGVAKALGRVQGKTRLLLETYRADARMAAMKRNDQIRQTRYEELVKEEARVLLPASEMPQDEEKPQVEEKTAVEKEADIDMFSEEKKSDDVKPAEKKADADMFGEEKKSDDVKPAEKKTDDTKPAKKSASLFGAMGKALGKAVIGSKSEKKATSGAASILKKAKARMTPEQLKAMAKRASKMSPEQLEAAAKLIPGATPEQLRAVAKKASETASELKPAKKAEAGDDPFVDEAPAEKKAAPKDEAKEEPKEEPAKKSSKAIDPDDPFAE